MEQDRRMKKIIIISPHFPPSNLTAVHRSRFIANHLPSFGWEPIILTVHEDYYEEDLDRNLEKLLPPALRIEKVKAMSVGRPRLIGDIGIRGFRSLYKRGKAIIQKEKIDFVYIPIPSFYAALLGRALNATTGVAYGIDYIDPWVHEFPGSDRLFSRHWWATRVSTFLEPIAVKKASLITGVAASYYEGVKERNPDLVKRSDFVVLPFGIEQSDIEKIKDLNIRPYLFNDLPGKIRLVYAGAMLPKAYKPLEEIFRVISANREAFSQLEIYFIGSGKSPNDSNGYNIKSCAEKYNLWQEVIYEYPRRIPYLDVLVHLSAASGIFILGSTEPHYTPSKVYQALLSQRPILAILHEESTAVGIIREAGEGAILTFKGEEGMIRIKDGIQMKWNDFLALEKDFDPSKINHSVFKHYSAKTITKILVDQLNKIDAGRK